MSKIKLFSLLFVMCLGTQIADILSTNYLIEKGIGSEGNPFVVLLMILLGTFWWIPKIFLGIFISVTGTIVWQESKLIKIAFALYFLLYLCVIINNLLIINIVQNKELFCGG